MIPIFAQNVGAVNKALLAKVDSPILSIDRLAKVILPGSLGVKNGERVLLVTDVSSSERVPESGPKAERLKILARWKSAIELAGGDVSVLIHEETGSHGKALPENGVLMFDKHGTADGVELVIHNSTEDVNVGDVLRQAQVLVGIHTFSATGPLKTIATETSARGFSMPTVNEDMETVMSADHSEFPAIAKKLKALLDPIERVRLRFTLGDIIYPLQIDKAGVGLHISDGTALSPGVLGNYPGAEDYFVPGKNNLTHGYWPILSADGLEVLVLRIIGGKIQLPNAGQATSFKDRTIIKVLEDLKRMPGNANFAELGLGLNPLARTGPEITVLEAEKALGVHLAYGQDSHFGGLIGNAVSDVHQDIVYPRSDARMKVELLALVGRTWQPVTW